MLICQDEDIFTIFNITNLMQWIFALAPHC